MYIHVYTCVYLHVYVYIYKYMYMVMESSPSIKERVSLKPKGCELQVNKPMQMINKLMACNVGDISV